MDNINKEDFEKALTAITSTIRKTEKVKETLSQKQPPRTSQMAVASRNLKALNIASSLIKRALGMDSSGNYSKEELEEAMQIISLFIRKIEEIKPKFREGTPQHTLAIRRIKAFQIASALIERE